MQIFLAKCAFGLSFMFIFIAYVVCCFWIDRVKRKLNHRAWGLHALLFLFLGILFAALVGMWVQGNALVGRDNLAFAFGVVFSFLFFVSMLFSFVSLLMLLLKSVGKEDRRKWMCRVFLFHGLALIFGVFMAVIIQ